MSGYLGRRGGGGLHLAGNGAGDLFLEAPLKFRAPGITIPLVWGSAGWCSVPSTCARWCWRRWPSVRLLPAIRRRRRWWRCWWPSSRLGAQVLGVRPALTRRSDAVLADASVAESGRSHAHFVYVGFEVVKVVALVATGVLLLN